MPTPEPAPANRTRVIACGALAREIEDLKRANELDHIDLVCLPAILHNHPEQIAPRLEAALEEACDAGFGDVLVGYGDCGTAGATERLASRYGARMLPGAHCYAFLSGVDSFGARDEIDAFYLTDFLARHFENFVVRPLKLRRHPELIAMMFAHYSKVVYLSQAEPAPYERQAREAATFLGLDYEHRAVGYGELESGLRSATKKSLPTS